MQHKNLVTSQYSYLYLLGLQNHCGWWLQPCNKKMLVYWKESNDKPRQHIKGQRQHFAEVRESKGWDKGWDSQTYGFSSRHVQMWELDHKEGWVLKNWCFRKVVLDKSLESPLDSKEIKPVNANGNQPWTFIGRTDVKVEAPILWPPDGKSWLWKRPWC